MTKEILQILLPKAIDLGNLQVAARQYDLSLFAFIQNMYPRVYVEEIRTIPNFAPVQIHLFRNDVELGRYAARDGTMDIVVAVDSDTPLKMRFFNLSVDSDVMVTLDLVGAVYHAV